MNTALMIPLLLLASASAYGFVAVHLASSLKNTDADHSTLRKVALATAIAIHLAYIAYTDSIFNGYASSFFDSLIYAALMVTMVALITNLKTKSSATLIPVAGFSAFVLGINSINFLLTNNIPKVTDVSGGIALHILLSITAYATLCVAAVYALGIMISDHALKRADFDHWSAKLPALNKLETLQFNLVILSWLCLSGSIITGFIFIENMLAQSLLHKTTFTLVSWLILTIIIVIRPIRGLNAQDNAKLTLWSFGGLFLGFVGSKFVLDIIIGA